MKLDFILFKKIIMYSIGLFFLALGVTISIKSNLGISPTNSVPYAISRVTGYQIGTMATTYFCFLILVQWMIVGKKFKLINIFQILFSTIFGYFLDFTNFLLVGFPQAQDFVIQIVLMVISIIVIALGLLFYLTAGIVAMPPEATIKVITEKINGNFAKIKVVFDCVSVTVSILLSYICLGHVEGIGIGTIISAIFVGKMLGVFNRNVKVHLEKIVSVPMIEDKTSNEELKDSEKEEI